MLNNPKTNPGLAVTVILLFCMAMPAVFADETFEDGRAAYQAGDYEKALTILRPLAEQGNSQAQVTLGIMYDYGQGVKQDDKEAMKWYIKAAEQGIPVVQHDVGVKYFQGLGVEQDYQEAAKWWELSANAGLADSQFNLGLLYYRGLGLKQDYSKAAELFRKAAAQGHSHAQYSLAVMYAFGNGMEKDYAEALKWFRESADQGVAQAQFNLGVFYENGYGLEKDMDKAKQWYQKAADQGLAEAQKKLDALARGETTAPVPATPAPRIKDEAEPPPVTADSGSTDVNRQGIRGEQWVMEQDADTYTLQLSSLPDEKTALKFIRNNKLESETAYFRVIVKNVPRYTVIFGVYENYDVAKKSIASLPESLRKNHPWVRNFGQLQKLIQESR
ncbi:MAG TPA: SPOR domain-containing protein [Gammaproteobacteria bacterium]|nr:SPOR domain-containing protein [Gammaproteobacteria bacterium]